MTVIRDHGGDLDRAQERFGSGDWIDLSTGINAQFYPVGEIPPGAWAGLPTRRDISALEETAQQAYGTRCACVALAGAQAAIQLIPRLMAAADARVVGPTYNEHGGALDAQGWQVQTVDELEALRGATLGVLVNPNNPDGRSWSAEKVLEVAESVGLLVVDESFADTLPELSILSRLQSDNVLVLRSFGKFYGLAGLRLGFALGAEPLVAKLRAFAGPWAVSGPAIAIAQRALADTAWQQETRVRLQFDVARLDTLAKRAGWSIVGGTPLFRTYETGDALAAQMRLARAHIWSRVFPYSSGWLRLGLPGDDAAWARLEKVMSV